MAPRFVAMPTGRCLFQDMGIDLAHRNFDRAQGLVQDRNHLSHYLSRAETAVSTALASCPAPKNCSQGALPFRCRYRTLGKRFEPGYAEREDRPGGDPGLPGIRRRIHGRRPGPLSTHRRHPQRRLPRRLGFGPTPSRSRPLPYRRDTSTDARFHPGHGPGIVSAATASTPGLAGATDNTTTGQAGAKRQAGAGSTRQGCPAHLGLGLGIPPHAP